MAARGGVEERLKGELLTVLRGENLLFLVFLLAIRHDRFFVGFAAGILNPKNAIFYLSLFTVMVSEQTGVMTRCFYALWMTTVVFIWDCGVVLVIGQPAVKARFGHGVFLVEKLSGVILTFFGLILPFST